MRDLMCGVIFYHKLAALSLLNECRTQVSLWRDFRFRFAAGGSPPLVPAASSVTLRTSDG